MTNTGLSVKLPSVETLQPGLVMALLNCYKKDRFMLYRVWIPLYNARSNRYQRLLPFPWYIFAEFRRDGPRTTYGDLSLFSKPEKNILITAERRAMDFKTEVTLANCLETESDSDLFVTSPCGMNGYYLRAVHPRTAVNAVTERIHMSSRDKDIMMLFHNPLGQVGRPEYIGVFLEAGVPPYVSSNLGTVTGPADIPRIFQEMAEESHHNRFDAVERGELVNAQVQGSTQSPLLQLILDDAESMRAGDIGRNDFSEASVYRVSLLDYLRRHRWYSWK